MFNVLIDTCVWLDLAADPRQRKLLDTLEAFRALGHIQLLVPKLVIEEFKRNRDRVAKAGVKGFSSQVQLVKEAIKSLELNARRRKSLYYVNLSELLARIDPSAFSEIQWEQSWSEEPRGISELWAAETMLSKQVWYNRHKVREDRIKEGMITIVPREQWEKGKRDNS